jgi:glycine/D-amino acid oxidase-like deaminating enzyme
MNIDCLIIGQGICGTFLAHEFEKAGLSFLVIDDPMNIGASRQAAGIINPITGRRMVRTWMIDKLFPFAFRAYQEIGKKLDIDCIRETRLVDFFPSAQMRLAFLKRYDESTNELFLPENENLWFSFFNYDFGFGEIGPCALVDLSLLLPAYRKKLSAAGLLMEEKILTEGLQIEKDHIQYEDIKAKKIIFCDGAGSFKNPYFSKLPFAPNKGEAMILSIDGLPKQCIFKKGMSLVPLKNNLYWIGSSYEWQFDNAGPTAVFRERVESLLRQWIKLPFDVMDHISSVRPATLERRPFVGFHPLFNQLGILNGMGTKGCSLAPYFAAQLTANLVEGIPILQEADITRHNRILGKSSV